MLEPGFLTQDCKGGVSEFSVKAYETLKDLDEDMNIFGNFGMTFSSLIHFCLAYIGCLFDVFLQVRCKAVISAATALEGEGEEGRESGADGHGVLMAAWCFAKIQAKGNNSCPVEHSDLGGTSGGHWKTA